MILPPAKASYSQPVASPTGWECSHPISLPVRRIASNRAMHYVYQCQDCGANIGSVAKHDRLALAPSDIGQWDDELRQRWWDTQSELRMRHFALIQEQRRDAWFEEATDYYASLQWHRKSRAVIERDKTCQACLRRPATEAHHLTYDHWMQEPLFDLVGVCHPCHEKITLIDRERRAR